MPEKLNIVPFVSVDNMMKLVLATGMERFLTDLAGYIEEDFRRWVLFDKTPRVASHSSDGVIELMPTSDGETYGFRYVNGHPKNTRSERQTVTALRRARQCRRPQSAPCSRPPLKWLYHALRADGLPRSAWMRAMPKQRSTWLRTKPTRMMRMV